MKVSEGVESTVILRKIKKIVKFVILLNDKYEYYKFCNQIR